MRTRGEALVGPLSDALRMGLDAMRAERDFAYECLTEGSARALSVEEADEIRSMDARIGACERVLEEADAWTGREGAGR